MAGHDDDGQDRPGGWGGRRGDPGGRGSRGERAQPWASRHPRSHIPYDTGYLGTEGSFGPGYDYGYQGNEWGRPVNVRPFGTRESYGTPERRIGRGRGWSGTNDWRTHAYRADYGRDYEFRPGRGGQPWGYFRGRGTEYGADFDDTPSGRGMPSRAARRRGMSGWGTSGRARYGGDFDQDLGRPRGRMGNADFGARPDRHYGHTPVDRWPADDPPRPDAPMDDDEVRYSVRENLFQDTFVNPDRIEVEVDRGVVTLRGEVDDFLEARYAWDDAWESPGVRGVINNLTVRTDRASDEMELPQTRHERESE